MIYFNKPFLTGKETHYIYEAVNSGKLSGNGLFTKKCQSFFEQKYAFKKALLTTSCTDALEMAAILANIEPGDELIVPSYTFVSSALAFVRQGAKIIFADSSAENPNIDTSTLESLITPKTKAIIAVHYAGIACNMEVLLELCKKYNLFLIEDAAQSIESYYIGNDGVKRPLGSIGHLAAFSFHETKNIISGEGGMLAINDERFSERAEIIWEKGTNRSQFFRGEVNKYGWVDTGSSFLPSEVIAAFLWAQLENIEQIQAKRIAIWETYHKGLNPLAQKGYLSTPFIPSYATNNAHMYYLVMNNASDRDALIAYLKEREVMPVFHYLSLHKSEYYKNKHDGRQLPQADRYSDCLLRLPFYYDLMIEEVEMIVHYIHQFFNNLK